MHNHWSRSELEVYSAAQAPTWGRELALLAYATRLVGAESDLALHGGGNTSGKGTITDVFGQNKSALFIKASGVDLASAEPADFVALDLEYTRKLLALPTLSDEEMADEFACHRLRPHSKRPSVETLVHACVPQAYVIHTHPSAVLALTNRPRGAEVVRAALGQGVAVVPYAAAGFDLAKAVSASLREAPNTLGLVLMHHGLVTWGDSAEEAYVRSIDLVGRAEAFLEQHCIRVLGSPARDAEEYGRRYSALAPVLRGVLGPKHADCLADRLVLQVLLDPDTMALLESPAGRTVALSAPLTPDHLIRVRRRALWLNDPRLDDPGALRAQLAEAVNAYQAEYRAVEGAHLGQSQLGSAGPDFSPRVLMIPGLGVICAGSDVTRAGVMRDITQQALRVKASIYAAGAEYLPLGETHLLEMEYRSYQQAKLLASPKPELGGTVTLVTGAAGAIGSGICEALLRAGCHVAATDLPGPSLARLLDQLAPTYGVRIMTAGMDVTDPDSVARGFAEVVTAWGGIDGVVVNAGIAHVATLAELSLEAFRRLEKVNVEGTLLVLAEAARQFSLQGTGGDVVLISTKNVFAPGASFGAYSATKAAAHQLARIASLELAPLSVRVNMVAPDAVFGHGPTRSGLWQEVGPSRMRARGLDQQGLEEYYRSRNLLKTEVTAEHVARAVLFFLRRETPTTGATLPVDGGLPDATPR